MFKIQMVHQISNTTNIKEQVIMGSLSYCWLQSTVCPSLWLSTATVVSRAEEEEDCKATIHEGKQLQLVDSLEIFLMDVTPADYILGCPVQAQIYSVSI